MSAHAAEVKSGERFEFGANWRDFLSQLSEERIRLARGFVLTELIYRGRQPRRQ